MRTFWSRVSFKEAELSKGSLEVSYLLFEYVGLNGWFCKKLD